MLKTSIMSTREMIEEIDKRLIRMSEKQLAEILSFLKEVEGDRLPSSINDEFGRIIEEDRNLLNRLAE